MASPKFLLFACALLLVQAQAHPQHHVKGLIADLIKDMVPIAENAIDWIMDKSGQAFSEASADPVAFQQKLAVKIEEGVGKAADLINERLDIIKEKGSANTAKVVECVKAAEEPSKTIIVGFYNRTTECIIPEVSDLLKKLADIQPDLQEIKTNAFAAADKVQDCSGSNEDEASCMALVIVDILDALKGTKSDVIQKALDIVLNIINKVELLVPKCVDPNLDQAKTETVAAIDDSTACMNA